MDSSAGAAAVWAAVGSLVTGLLAAAVAAYLKVADQRHTHQQQSQGTALAEYRELAERLEKDNQRLREQRDQMIARATVCYQRCSRAEERILALQDLLRAHEVPFREWVTDGGSGSSLDVLDG